MRISEALDLRESDLDATRDAILVRHGKGKRREVGMDRWAWKHLDPWLERRRDLPIGALLCVLHGSTAGITSIYLQGIDNAEIVNTVHGRPSPTISATAGLAITR